MKKFQRLALAAAATAAAAAAGLGVVAATANATTASPAHSTQVATASGGGGASVRANERVVEAFLQGTILGIKASGRNVSWDGVDVYRLSHGKISNIWAGDDWSAILYDTGTYKAPWIS
jgi:ABC-type glycerol-3-phosphate transport system substrate-binding protein